jgi:methyl-accepting chemotaxis protein
MSEGAKELLNSGVLGALVVVLFGLLAWAFRAMFAGQQEDRRDFKRFMEATIEAQRQIVASVDAIKTNCLACRADGVAAVRDEGSRMRARLEDIAAGLRGDVDTLRRATAGAAEAVEAAAEELSEAVARTPSPMRVG